MVTTPVNLRLSIELVPRTCWWSNVRTNVTRAEWEKCKNFVKNRSQERCEICAGQGSRHAVECHEIWAYDDRLKVQTLVDLVALCPPCHEVKHIGRAFAIGRAPQAIMHLCETNYWTLPVAEVYIDRAFRQWEERSRHNWTLDVSFLTSVGVSLPEQIDREKGRRET